MLPPALAVRSRAATLLCILFTLAGVSACERAPTELERSSDAELAPWTGASLVNAYDQPVCGVGKKTAEVTVLSDGSPAEGVVVSWTRVASDGESACWATTGPDGTAMLTKLPKDQLGVIMARPGLSAAALAPRIIPWTYGLIDPVDLAPSGPDMGGSILFGTDCTEAAPLSTASYTAAVTTAPCVVPGSRIEATVALQPAAHTIQHTVVAPDGTPQPNAIVSAVAVLDCDALTANGTQLFANQCADAEVIVHGVAVLQSTRVADNDGLVTLYANDDVGIEALWQDAAGNTLFASSFGDNYLDSYWGMCDESAGTFTDAEDGGSGGGLDLLGGSASYATFLSSDVSGGRPIARLEADEDRIVINLSAARAASTGIDHGRVSVRIDGPFGNSNFSFGFSAGPAGECSIEVVSDATSGVNNSGSACRLQGGEFLFQFVLNQVPSFVMDSPDYGTVDFDIRTPQDQITFPQKNSYYAGFFRVMAPRLTADELCRFDWTNDLRYRGDL